MNTTFHGYNLVTATQSVLRQYACFSGRATRSEYWWFQVGLIIIDIVAIAVASCLVAVTEAPGLALLANLVSLAFVLPSLAVLVRRMHDIGKSGLNIFWGLLPFAGAIILFVFCCQDSQCNNQYGPSEKYPD